MEDTLDRIIAGTTLGFWIGLFSAKYEQRLWTGHTLRGVFQHAPKIELGCHSIRRTLNRIRYLRNRVFHHEPIWHWSELDGTYVEIARMNKWLSPEWASILSQHDRFPAVHQGGSQPYLDRLISD